MKTLKKIIHWKLKLIVLIVLPIVVFLMITSKTDQIGGVRSFVVLSGSMEPELPVGSVVFTKKTGDYIKGDVITFQNAGMPVTHRIAAVENGQFKTKGDANKNADGELIAKNQVLGEQVFMVPFIGRFIAYLRTLQGLILFIIVPSILFILFELWNMKHHMEREAEKKIRKKMEAEATTT